MHQEHARREGGRRRQGPFPRCRPRPRGQGTRIQEYMTSMPRQPATLCRVQGCKDRIVPEERSFSPNKTVPPRSPEPSRRPGTHLLDNSSSYCAHMRAGRQVRAVPRRGNWPKQNACLLQHCLSAGVRYCVSLKSFLIELEYMHMKAVRCCVGPGARRAGQEREWSELSEPSRRASCLSVAPTAAAAAWPGPTASPRSLHSVHVAAQASSLLDTEALSDA